MHCLLNAAYVVSNRRVHPVHAGQEGVRDIASGQKRLHELRGETCLLASATIRSYLCSRKHGLFLLKPEPTMLDGEP